MGLQWPGGSGGGGGGGSPLINTIVKTATGTVFAQLSDFGENHFIRFDNGASDVLYTFDSVVLSGLTIGSSFTVWQTGTGVIALSPSGMTFESAYGSGGVGFRGAAGFLVFIYLSDTNKFHVTGPVEL